MIFNSNAFLAFLAVVSLLYGLVRHRASHRDWLILVASLVFYGWWDWRFLGLLMFTGGVDFWCAQRISLQTNPGLRRRWLWLSVVSNLGTLGFFKYAGFFVDSAAAALGHLGLSIAGPALHIVLPAGISFYTFQALSYTVDVYRGQVAAERNPVRYFAFLTFFPQLVAGPIERASFLLPQFRQPREVTQARMAQGIWLILWGFFLKVVIADSLAPLVDLAFGSRSAGGSVILWGTLAFGGQIYGDFAGYSAIARGVANTMGFELSPNFAQPYLAQNIQEFWRRWHQSLSTWFRDYVYVPLGGDRKGSARTFFNITATFVLAGLWHGANWTFLLWGLCHGVALGVFRLWRASSLGQRFAIPKPVGWLLTLAVVSLGWLFFRASSIGQAFELIQAIGNRPAPAWEATYRMAVVPGLAAIGFSDLFHRRFPPELIAGWHWPRRAAIQGALLIAIIVQWGKVPPGFLYFQF
jgi:D-alanyl-lipoteichoic acid acyltransferase DltB (MBOAT superfamily)